MNEHDYQQRILELEKQNTKLASRNHYLEELFRLAQHKQFGKSSEGHSGQGELFNEVEEILVVDINSNYSSIGFCSICYEADEPELVPEPSSLMLFLLGLTGIIL
jgi:transposase